MLEAFRKAFKIKDIRKKIGYTFLMLIVIRIGSQLPTPGVNGEYIKNFFAQNTGEAFNLFNAFTGGSFEQMSVFALSITPYITSSIIVQLLTIAIPQLEEMQRDGETGRKKIVAITRYLTVGLALIESGAMAVGFGRQGLLVKYNFVNAAIVVLTLTAGSAFLMWIGERITEKGVGNGISIVLVINIISRIPSDMKTLFDQFVKGKAIASACLAVCVIIAIILALVVFTVILQDGERRIAVQYSQKIVGRRSYGGQSTNIPLKVNTAGVIPIIFSSSLMQFPIVIASFLGKDNGSGIGSEILRGLNQSNWCNPEQIKYSWGLVLYIVLTVFFAYFYTSITFNPLEIANNMKKSGGFIPGIRPGRPTVEYLTKILNYIIFVGACGLILVQIVPILFNGWLGAKVSFGGTSLIIIVSVILETLKQIDSMTLVNSLYFDSREDFFRGLKCYKEELPMKIIMLGAPGAGKGTQAKKIAAKYDIPHISTGDIFRANIKNGTELGNKAKTYMDQGLLVPDELVVDLVVDRVQQDDCKNGYVLDGFPRTIPQAEALDKALAEFGDKIDYAIDVNVPDENIVKRMGGRRACVGCGATYHLVYAPTKTEGICDVCGKELILRDDDKPETVQKRLNVYHEQTQPLIDYYTKAGILKTVDGTVDINDVFAAIVEILGA